MADIEPSNAVLLVKLDSLNAIVLANQVVNAEAHAALLTQTTKTNGRVTALERFKNIALGAFLVLNVLVIPLIIEFFKK